MSWSNFNYKENTHAERKPGIYRCIILNAEQAISKSSGNKMLVITLRPSGTVCTVKAYITDNDYFDANLSEFIDAFPELKENFSINRCASWRGALGAAKFILDNNGYLKSAKYPWISAKKAEKLPPFEWRARANEPRRMPVYTGEEENQEDDYAPF